MTRTVVQDGGHLVDARNGGFIECPSKPNATWAWDQEGFTGAPPPNCPVCGAEPTEWFYTDAAGDVQRYVDDSAPEEAAR